MRSETAFRCAAAPTIRTAGVVTFSDHVTPTIAPSRAQRAQLLLSAVSCRPAPRRPLPPRLERCEPLEQCVLRQLGDAVQVELVHDPAAVGLDGLGADAQCPPDLLRR